MCLKIEINSECTSNILHFRSNKDFYKKNDLVYEKTMYSHDTLDPTPIAGTRKKVKRNLRTARHYHQ